MKTFHLNNSGAFIQDGDGIVASSNTKKFIRNFFGRDSGLLSPAIRWMGNTSMPSVIYERKPTIVKILYAGNVYHINTPWIVYGTRLLRNKPPQVKAYARHSPIRSMDDKLHILPLPGISPDGTVASPIGNGLQTSSFVHKKYHTSLQHCLSRPRVMIFNLTRIPKPSEIASAHIPENIGAYSDGDVGSTTKAILKAWENFPPIAAAEELKYRESSGIETVQDLCDDLSKEEDIAASSTLEYLESIIKF